MDILFLHGMKIHSTLGVYAWERVHTQQLLLDLDITLPHSRAFVSDEIDDTIDYAFLTARLREHVADLQCCLLEALAEEIARFVMHEFNIPQIKIRLVKPGILPEVASVGVEIVRGECP